MSDYSDVTELLAGEGPWTFAYVDGPGAEPQVVEEARRDSVRDRLLELGAPEDDARAVLRAMEQPTGAPSPSARYLLVRGGEVALDASFAEPRRGPERLGHGRLPEILPLVRHRSSAEQYVVVETGREGASVRLECAERAVAEQTVEVEGRDDSLPKVQAGGWSHARYQRHSEEIWKQNQGEVAEVVDRLVREERPALVVLAGDVRARQLLRDQLAPASRGLVIEVEAHTRAAGADEQALDEAISRALTEHAHSEVQRALDRLASDGGGLGARGVDEVVEALQQGRVDTLLLDSKALEAGNGEAREAREVRRGGDDGRGEDARSRADTLEALDAPPWVTHGGIPAEASSLGLIPVAEALARAAILTGARVRVLEEEHASEDEPRSNRPPREPVALLRWSEDAISA